MLTRIKKKNLHLYIVDFNYYYTNHIQKTMKIIKTYRVYNGEILSRCNKIKMLNTYEDFKI